jgi:hypothetical protein
MFDTSALDILFGCGCLAFWGLIVAVVALLGVALSWWTWSAAGIGSAAIAVVTLVFVLGLAKGAAR